MVARTADSSPHSELALMLGRTTRDERPLVVRAFLVAAALHVGLLSVSLPRVEVTAPRPEPGPEPPNIHSITLPPPEIRRPPATAATRIRRVPVPVTDHADIEPLPEPAPPLDFPAVPYAPPELEFSPEPPMPDVPRIPGLGGVTQPALVPGTRTVPTYPELARIAGIPGEVILQAVILRDGSVGEIELLRCSRPGLGFEQAAADAVSEWRYAPATHRGDPVDVYFTIVVTFSLQ